MRIYKYTYFQYLRIYSTYFQYMRTQLIIFNYKAARMIGESAEFDVFLSYRVESDSDHVAIIYKMLTDAGVKVWWDRECLVSMYLYDYVYVYECEYEYIYIYIYIYINSFMDVDILI